jgi:hypothetical protein
MRGFLRGEEMSSNKARFPKFTAMVEKERKVLNIEKRWLEIFLW